MKEECCYLEPPGALGDSVMSLGKYPLGQQAQNTCCVERMVHVDG